MDVIASETEDGKYPVTLDGTLEERHERYKEALWRIANAQSGHWGWIASEALFPKEKK